MLNDRTFSNGQFYFLSLVKSSVFFGCLTVARNRVCFFMVCLVPILCSNKIISLKVSREESGLTFPRVCENE